MTVTGTRLVLLPPVLLFQPHGYHDTSCAPGSGFHELYSIWPPVKHDIAVVFIHLGEFSAVVQHYAGATCGPVVLDLLGDSRNLVHHQLLSLPDENDAPELIFECQGQNIHQNELSQEIYLTCRLSAILYAVHVTFPIPRSRSPAQTILKALCPRIERLCARNASQPLLVWCVAVVISVLGESSPDSLIMYMTYLSHTVGVDTVPKLMALLQSFAWVDAAVGNCWKDMWARIFRQ
ncbi:hypothetical protein BDW75DRAFT_249824 [Aspergillus navahoensis]